VLFRSPDEVRRGAGGSLREQRGAREVRLGLGHDALLAEGAARAAAHLVGVNLAVSPADERLRRARAAVDAARGAARSYTSQENPS